MGRIASDYRALIPEHAYLLLGPKYALLRPEFAQLRANSLARREIPKLRHILITMGGVDANNVTGQVLSALQGCDIITLNQITVVLGFKAPWRDQVLTQSKKMFVPTQVLSGVNNMAELMTACDLAIGAGGTTTWERCALGVPSILVVLAKNQRNIADFMFQTSAAFVIDIDQPVKGVFNKALQNISNSRNLRNFSQACAQICDGTGIERVVSKLEYVHG